MFARIHYPEVFKNKTKKEIYDLLSIIYNETLRDIAISYYVKEECQIDIAMRYKVDRKTIEKYLKKAIEQVEHK